MTAALWGSLACGAAPAPVSSPAPEPAPMAVDTAEQHARNLRFRDNAAVFDDSARWLDAHRAEALPPMVALLAERGPAAIGVARVLGKFGDPQAVGALEAALSAADDELAFEAARALAR
ncbi:MAG: hypothetical protein ABMA64_42755, partial [Myxococcota bacterium]